MIRLDDTTGNAVAAAIASQRHKMGSPAVGMVLTLLVMADEESQADAVAAATAAAREHPMRILVLIPRPGGRHVETRLDAEELGRLEEDVGLGLAAGNAFSRHEPVDEAVDANALEDFLDEDRRGRRGDRSRTQRPFRRHRRD